MLYMLLICYDPSKKPRDDEPTSLQPRHAAVEKEMKAEGIFACGAALMPPELEPAQRLREGKVTPIEGPFTESREFVGGFYIVECKDDAAAARQAARIPVSSISWIEVRRVPLFHADADFVARLA
jgi:hypothetical protein